MYPQHTSSSIDPLNDLVIQRPPRLMIIRRPKPSVAHYMTSTSSAPLDEFCV